MKRFFVIFVFTLVATIICGTAEIATAAVAGESCTVTVGNAGVGSQSRTGVCRPYTGTGSVCQTNEDNLGFGNCVVSGGVASQCCSVKIPSSTCTGNNGVCVQAGSCTSARPGTCYPSSTEVCCDPGAIRVEEGFSITNLINITGPSVGNYTLLESIPGSDNSVGRLNTYLEDIYRFAFWTVGIAVVFMLTIGGFMYLTSAGNTSRMESAKTVIFDAILGLVLALVAWLFLYVVNPNLVNLNLTAVSIRPISSTAPASTTGDATGGTTPPPTSSGLYTHAEAMAALANGISVSSSGNCSNQNNASCTSLEGIPAPVVNRINALRNASGCNLVITGGTETGHKTHGTGRGSVDFREDSCLGNFLRDNVTQYTTYGIAKICAPTNWQAAVRASCVEPSGSPHFHIQFSI